MKEYYGKRRKKETNSEIKNKEDEIKKIKQNKKKKKKKHRFLKFIIFLILLIIGIRVYFLVKEIHIKNKFSKIIKETMLVLPNEEIKLTKEQLKQDWNKDGITNEKKLELGLNIFSKDTDGDEISDYDEINKYHSDPKKYSTSGDSFSDGYKIKNGYDINKKYKERLMIKTSNKNITLIGKKAEDIEAYYKEYKGNIPNGYTSVMKPFRIYSFNGEAQIKIQNPKNYEVISYDNINKKTKKIKSKVDKNILKFNVPNDNPILIVYKNKILEKIGTNINSTINLQNKKDSEYLIISMPIFNILYRVPIYIFEVNDQKENKTEINKIANMIRNRSNNLLEVEVNNISRIDAKALELIAGGVKNEIKSYVKDDKSLVDYIILYKHVKSEKELEKFLFDTMEENKEEEKEEETKYEFEEKYENKEGKYYANSGFSVTKNAFKFSNLQTKVSEGGVCLGFADITTNIFNNGEMPKSIKEKYNLKGEDFDTIWAKNLYSYNPTSELAKYADDIRKNEDILNSNKMKKPDSEVVKCIEHYFLKTNKELIPKKLPWAFQSSMDKQSYIKEETVKNLVEQFKNNKIVTVLLLGEGQHAINAYKIVEDKEDEDILYIKVYDNNIPSDMFWKQDGEGKQKYDVTITLKRCYKNKLLGGKETYYIYEYNPLNDENYKYGSFHGKTDFIIFIDENNKSM